MENKNKKKNIKVNLKSNKISHNITKFNLKTKVIRLLQKKKDMNTINVIDY
jgi:hypothetical protein